MLQSKHCQQAKTHCPRHSVPSAGYITAFSVLSAHPALQSDHPRHITSHTAHTTLLYSQSHSPLMSPSRAHLPFSHFPQLSPSPRVLPSLRATATRAARPLALTLASRVPDRTLASASHFAHATATARDFAPDPSRAPRTFASTITQGHRAFAPPRTVSGPTKTRFRRWHGRRTSLVGNHAYVSLSARGSP